MVEWTRTIAKDKNVEANQHKNKTTEAKNELRRNKQVKSYSKICLQTLLAAVLHCSLQYSELFLT